MSTVIVMRSKKTFRKTVRDQAPRLRRINPWRISLPVFLSYPLYTPKTSTICLFSMK